MIDIILQSMTQPGSRFSTWAGKGSTTVEWERRGGGLTVKIEFCSLQTYLTLVDMGKLFRKTLHSVCVSKTFTWFKQQFDTNTSINNKQNRWWSLTTLLFLALNVTPTLYFTTCFPVNWLMLHHIQIVAPIIYKCSSREKQDLVEPIFIAMLRNFQMWFIVLAQKMSLEK